MKHICSSLELVKTFSVLNIFLRIIRVALPLIIIVMTIIGVAGAVTSNDQTKLNAEAKKAGIRILAAIIIILLPSLTRAIFNTFSNYNKEEDAFCLFDVTRSDVEEILEAEASKSVDTAVLTKTYYAYNTAASYVAKVENSSKKAELAAQLKSVKSDIDKAEKERRSTRASNIASAAASLSSSGSDQTFQGTKFNLSDKQIKGLTNMCVREQGSDINAIKFEASLMGNLADLHKKDVYTYVRTSGWFGHDTSLLDSPRDSVNGNKITPEMIAAVKDVLVNGNRTTEANEHDCFGDITKVVNLDNCSKVTSSNNGRCNPSNKAIKDRNLYKPGKSVIYNRYGAVYTFLAFPSSTSDPFGKLVNESDVKKKCPNA